MDSIENISVSLDDLAKLEYLTSDFSLLPKQAVNSILSGKHASKLRGRGLDFSEVRKYVYGDDIRNIDWKVTARTKTTHTKVFNEEKERPAYLIVDQSSSMFFASEGCMKSVIAAQIAAIGAYKVLKAGDRIGGLVFDDENFESIQPKRSRKALMHFLETIVQKNQNLVKRKEMISKKAFINKVLYKAQNMITHDYVVIVISDFQELDDQGRMYLSSISKHNDVIAIMISDPMEKELPEASIPVGDGQNQIMIKDNEDTRSKFTSEAISLKNKGLQFLHKYSIPVLEFNTVDPLQSQIKNLFTNYR